MYAGTCFVESQGKIDRNKQRNNMQNGHINQRQNRPSLKTSTKKQRTLKIELSPFPDLRASLKPADRHIEIEALFVDEAEDAGIALAEKYRFVGNSIKFVQRSEINPQRIALISID